MSALVQLPQERIVLERGELVGLDEVGELAQANRAGLLARLEERSNIVLRQQAVYVNGRHGRVVRRWHNSPIVSGYLSSPRAVRD